MIKLVKTGKYSILETFSHTKILILDNIKYAWVTAEGIGEILVSTKGNFKYESKIATGAYRIYEIKNEKDLTDLYHLELFLGDGSWQGYLLPTGLPNGKLRRKIIPTKEKVSVINSQVF